MLLKAIEENKQIIGYSFACPGCGHIHSICVYPHKNPNGASWSFNQDFDAPTFHPSINETIKFSGIKEPKICHFFVTNGRIRFLSDCTHKLSGQEAAMIPLED